MKVIIEKVVEDFWGADDLVRDMEDWGEPREKIELALIELFSEDYGEFMEDATWTIEYD